jgi:hypothetical protein
MQNAEQAPENWCRVQTTPLLVSTDLEGGKISIWQAGTHDNPFGQRLTALMKQKSRGSVDVFIVDHPNVQFNYFRGGIGVCETEMH